MWTATPRCDEFVAAHAPVAGPRRLSDQVVEGGQLAAEVSLRQFEQQRGDRLGDRLEIVEGDQPGQLADRAPDQAVHAGETLVLVPGDVTVGMPQHRAGAAGVGVHAQDGGLGHGAAGQEDGGRLAEQLGDLTLEIGDDAALAVEVGLDVVADRGDHLGRAAETVAEEGVSACGAARGDLVHRASLAEPVSGGRASGSRIVSRRPAPGTPAA
jgi:hypothetical protein